MQKGKLNEIKIEIERQRSEYENMMFGQKERIFSLREENRKLKEELETYKRIVAHYDPRGAAAIGAYERFAFYEEAKKAFCIVQTGETAVYANLILQKGVIQADPGLKARYLQY